MTATKEGEPSLAERVARAEAAATPYSIARDKAVSKISIYATPWASALLPWDENRAVSIIGNKPRRTKEGHEARQQSARKKLGALVAALRDPDSASKVLLFCYPDIAVALYALKPEHREKLADGYQQEIDEYDARQ